VSVVPLILSSTILAIPVLATFVPTGFVDAGIVKVTPPDISLPGVPTGFQTISLLRSS